METPFSTNLSSRTLGRERTRGNPPSANECVRRGEETQAHCDGGDFALTFNHRRVRQLKSGGNFTDAQSVGQMIKNQPVRRIKPLAEGRENVSGGHLGEDRFLRNRIGQKLVKAAALAEIVGRRIRQANPAFSVFQRIDAAALAEEVEQVMLATLEITNSDSDPDAGCRVAIGESRPPAPDLLEGFGRE